MRNCFFHDIRRKMENSFLNWQFKGDNCERKGEKIADRYFDTSALYCSMCYDSRSGIGRLVNYRVQASGYQCIHVRVKE